MQVSMLCSCYHLTLVLCNPCVCHCLLHYCTMWSNSCVCGEATSNANTYETMIEQLTGFLTSFNIVFNITIVFLDIMVETYIGYLIWGD